MSVMSTQLEPPFTTPKKDTGVVIFLQNSRMRSSRNVLLAIFASFLLCTALYFGYRSYHREAEVSRELVPAELIILQPVSEFKKEHVEKQEKLPTENSLPVNEPPPEVITNAEVKEEKKEEKEETQHETHIRFTDNGQEIDATDGSVFLKSMLKDMKCVMGDSSTYSVSCCGVMSLSDNHVDDHHGCILMDTYNEYGNEPTYRLRYILDNDEMPIYETTYGFPKPTNKCYPIESTKGVDVCASVNYLKRDEEVNDNLGYNTCTFLKFGYNKKNPQELLGFSETVGCDSNKELLTKMSFDTPYSLILRLNVKSPIEEYPKQVQKPDDKSEKTGDLNDSNTDKASTIQPTEASVEQTEAPIEPTKGPVETPAATETDSPKKPEAPSEIPDYEKYKPIESSNSEQDQTDPSLLDLIMWPETLLLQQGFRPNLGETTDGQATETETEPQVTKSDNETENEESDNESNFPISDTRSSIVEFFDTVMRFIRENLINVIARPFLN